MNRESSFRLVGMYLKSRMWPIIVCLFVAASFFSVCGLTGLALHQALYALSLSLCAVGLYLFLDGRRYVRRLRVWLELAHAPEDADDRPDSPDAETRAVASLLARRDRAFREALEESERARQDAVDYYTLWTHQIKTPIAAMRIRVKDDPTLQSELFQIERYAEMALQNARMANLSGDIHMEECDLNERVKSAVRKYAPLFVEKRLSATVEPLSSSVLCDKKWLGFLLEQVISNAVKYTFSGGVRFYMDGGALCVEDTGVGISPEELPRIFEKGFTGMNGRRDERASGLGLYMVKRISKSLGMQVSARSTPGRGTVIRLAFPREIE